MADLNSVWDDNDLAELDSIPAAEGRAGPIPPDDYLMQVEKQEMKPTKDQTGVILSMQYTVLEGPFEGRKVFSNINVKNKNAQAQQIGIGEFKALCLACGLEFADVKNETEILTGVPFRAKVGMQKTTPEYPDPRNEVKKYYPADGMAPAAPVAAAPAARPAASPKAAAAAAPAGRTAPAWMQKKAS